jgi:hypothetical protein
MLQFMWGLESLRRRMHWPQWRGPRGFRTTPTWCPGMLASAVTRCALLALSRRSVQTTSLALMRWPWRGPRDFQQRQTWCPFESPASAALLHWYSPVLQFGRWHRIERFCVILSCRPTMKERTFLSPAKLASLNPSSAITAVLQRRDCAALTAGPEDYTPVLSARRC